MAEKVYLYFIVTLGAFILRVLTVFFNVWLFLWVIEYFDLINYIKSILDILTAQCNNNTVS